MYHIPIHTYAPDTEEIIARLRAMNPDSTVKIYLGDLIGDAKVVYSDWHIVAWRGDYKLSSIEPRDEPDYYKNAGKIADHLKTQMWKEMEGWKGGDFTISKRSPIFVSEHREGDFVVIDDIFQKDESTVAVTTRDYRNEFGDYGNPAVEWKHISENHSWMEYPWGFRKD